MVQNSELLPILRYIQDQLRDMKAVIIKNECVNFLEFSAVVELATEKILFLEKLLTYCQGIQTFQVTSVAGRLPLEIIARHGAMLWVLEIREMGRWDIEGGKEESCIYNGGSRISERFLSTYKELDHGYGKVASLGTYPLVLLLLVISQHQKDLNFF